MQVNFEAIGAIAVSVLRSSSYTKRRPRLFRTGHEKQEFVRFYDTEQT